MAGLLLTHSTFNLENVFLTVVTHAPIGILGAFAGWSRWLELQLPEPAAPRTVCGSRASVASVFCCCSQRGLGRFHVTSGETGG
jgi:hypothetical protein